MSEIKVKDLANVTTLSTTNKLMVLTDSTNNTVKNITVANAISGIISSDADNKIVHGSDGKLYVEAFGNITGDLDNLTTTNKTNLVNAINEVNGNVGTLSNLETTEKSNLVNAINEIANVVEPSLQYDVMNNSKAMETGGVYSNSVIYQDVYKYAHSSFDLSKFTVVGSPIITSDGIVSGFLASKYVRINKTINGPFRFKGRFRITNDENSYRCACSFLANNTAGLFAELRVRGTGFYFIYAQDSSTRTSVNESYTFADDTWYDYEFVYDGTTLDLLINGVSVITPVTPYFEAITGINIGVTFGAALSFAIGEIDLKYIELKENDTPTFNGNKTGLDVIKPDNYTVVGTLVISTDGIATFASGQYIKGVVPNLADAPNVTIEVECTVSDGASGYSMLVIDQLGATYGLVLWRDGARIKLRCNTNSNLASFVWTANKKYRLKVEKVGNAATFTATSEGQTVYTSTVDVSDMLPFSGNIEIGNRNATPTTSFWQGTIDLNTVEFNINGAVKYQPCLKIPYTASADKYGGKIVDNYYIDRVQSCYKQGYPQKYYTIDEVNNSFTLPMGEIYGMIEQKVNKSDLQEATFVIETYHNGASWYRIWSDGWCEQGGETTVAGMPGTVTLLKEYRDTSYLISITPYQDTDNVSHNAGFTSAITTTSFGFRSERYIKWETKGYII